MNMGERERVIYRQRGHEIFRYLEREWKDKKREKEERWRKCNRR